MSDDQNYMTNAEGHLVPVSKVKEEDKLENVVVEDIFKVALQLSRRLGDFKRSAFDDVQAFLGILEEKYGVTKGGKKGNITLTSFDGLSRIQVAVADYIQFGPQLQVAKELIDECIGEWGKDSNDNIRVLVDHAFRVDKNNRVNTQAILGLRRLNITDANWQRAMEAINDSIRVTHSKQYIRFYQRPSPEAEWQAVNLDIARV